MPQEESPQALPECSAPYHDTADTIHKSPVCIAAKIYLLLEQPSHVYFFPSQNTCPDIIEGSPACIAPASRPYAQSRVVGVLRATEFLEALWRLGLELAISKLERRAHTFLLGTPRYLLSRRYGACFIASSKAVPGHGTIRAVQPLLPSTAEVGSSPDAILLPFS